MKSNSYRATQKRTGGARSRGSGVRDNARLTVVCHASAESLRARQSSAPTPDCKATFSVDKYY